MRAPASLNSENLRAMSTVGHYSIAMTTGIGRQLIQANACVGKGPNDMIGDYMTNPLECLAKNISPSILLVLLYTFPNHLDVLA
jgi:hypothetical protein